MNVLMFYRAFKQAEKAERQQKEVDAMCASTLNYGIIRDLINSAYNGVVIELTLRDGTKLLIKREDQFDQLQKKYSEAF